MAIDVLSMTLSRNYTSESMNGGGAVKGKNCTISSISEIEGGNRITFSYTLDNGTVKTSTLDVMNGSDGKTPVKNVDYFDGADGKGISSIKKTSTNGLVDVYTITYTDKSTSTFKVTNGADGSNSGISEEQIVNIISAYMEENADNFKGTNGTTPNLTIGTVETLASGSNATASISGTPENPVLNLGIPKGKDGTSGTGSVGGEIYYYKPVPIETTAGIYWKADGTLGDNTTEMDSYIKKVSATNAEQYISVTEGEVYRLSLGSLGAISSTFSVTQCVFLDESDNLVSVAFDTINYKDSELVTVPEGARKMHFTIWSGAYPIIEKQVAEPCEIVNEFEVKNFIDKMNEQPRKTYAPFDKGYISFVNDDSLAIVSELADLFEEKQIPLCMATIYSNLNNLATTGTVLEAVKKVVENDGEVLSHEASVITSDNIDDFDIMYKQFAKSKKMLQLYGFDVDGIILAGGTGQVAGTEKTDRWARAYYQYSDLYGNSDYGYPYYHYRVGLSNHTLESAKALVDKAIENKEWVSFYLHTWAEFSKEDLTALLDYIKEKDSRILETVTYKQIYNKFVINKTKEVVTIAANKTTTVYETRSSINTDDIVVTAYYDDGSAEQITDAIIVDLSEVDTSQVGNYYMSVSYGDKVSYIPISIYSSDDRVVLYSGMEGSYITWELYSDGVIELANTATWKQSVANYADGEQPWYEHMNLIKKVKINSGNAVLGTLGEYAFYGATNLTEVDFAENSDVVTLSGYALGNCGLVTPTIANVGQVSTNAFNGCPITELTLGATMLMYNSLAGCDNLTSLRLTNANMTIDAGALQGVKGTLTDIYVPWSDGTVANAPWGATNATVHYETI